jgi:hypothetical protein
MHRRAAWIAGATALATFAAGDAGAALRDDFAWSLPLEVPAGAPVVRLDVPLAVYRDSVDPGLGDLRVLNGAGEVVPFALRRPEPSVHGMPTTLSMPFFPLHGAEAVSGAALQLRIDAGRAFIEVQGGEPAATSAPISGYLMTADHFDRAIDALVFNWPDESPDFSMNLTIAVSEDLVHWRVIVPRAPLARLRHGGQVFEQRTVDVPATRARYWRVSPELPGELPVITLAAATLVMGSIPVERLQLAITGTADPERAGSYLFDLAAQLPVDRVTLALPDVNTVAQVEFHSRSSSREAWRLLNNASVYRIQSANGDLVSEFLIVPPVPQRYWRVGVDQRGGGIGGGTPQLRVGWLADQLVFMTRGSGPFEIVYGNAESVGTAAGVPLETLLPSGDATFARLTEGGIPLAHAGERREAGGPARLLPPPPPGPWRLWILWAALLGGVAVLGAVAFKLARQMRSAS